MSGHNSDARKRHNRNSHNEARDGTLTAKGKMASIRDGSPISGDLKAEKKTGTRHPAARRSGAIEEGAANKGFLRHIRKAHWKIPPQREKGVRIAPARARLRDLP